MESRIYLRAGTICRYIAELCNRLRERRTRPYFWSVLVCEVDPREDCQWPGGQVVDGVDPARNATNEGSPGAAAVVTRNEGVDEVEIEDRVM